MRHLVVSGSPRAHGRSAVLAQRLASDMRAAAPDTRVDALLLADLRIAPCTGCGFCAGSGACAPDPCAAGTCVLADDMAALRARLDACDALTLVSPVYFSGAPAQLKALLDRLQPYFYTDWRRTPKRPADLHVVGDGGDPHGFAPLVCTVRSALAVAGFRLRDVYDWVGLLPADPSATAAALAAAPADPAAPAAVRPRVRPAQDCCCSVEAQR